MKREPELDLGIKNLLRKNNANQQAVLTNKEAMQKFLFLKRWKHYYDVA